jgi:hypothetical protein
VRLLRRQIDHQPVGVPDKRQRAFAAQQFDLGYCAGIVGIAASQSLEGDLAGGRPRQGLGPLAVVLVVPLLGGLDGGDAVRHDHAGAHIELPRVELLPPFALALLLSRLLTVAARLPSGKWAWGARAGSNPSDGLR